MQSHDAARGQRADTDRNQRQRRVACRKRFFLFAAPPIETLLAQTVLRTVVPLRQVTSMPGFQLSPPEFRSTSRHRMHLRKKSKTARLQLTSTGEMVGALQRTGFWLMIKRLEADRFKWPKDAEVITLSVEQLHWLLTGIDLAAMRPHTEKKYLQAG